MFRGLIAADTIDELRSTLSGLLAHFDNVSDFARNGFTVRIGKSWIRLEDSVDLNTYCDRNGISRDDALRVIKNFENI